MELLGLALTSIYLQVTWECYAAMPETRNKYAATRYNSESFLLNEAIIIGLELGTSLSPIINVKLLQEYLLHELVLLKNNEGGKIV